MLFGFSSLRCCDCGYLDITDKNKYGEAYCAKERDYVSLDSVTCRYFEPNFYVMTAYCNINKLPYMNDMMITLINLRDVYMMNNEVGIEFLQEYENIGKELAYKLQVDMYRKDIIDDMEFNYIIPAVISTKNGDFENAQQAYIDMIEMLKIRYGYTPKTKVLKK